MEVAQEAIDTWRNMRKNNGDHRYIILKIAEDNEKLVTVDVAGEKNGTWDDFKAAMPKDLPRFAVFDLQYKTNDGRQESKLCFFMYCPDNCTNGKIKFAYSNNKAVVRSKIDPINKEFQVNDHDDLKENDFIEEFK